MSNVEDFKAEITPQEKLMAKACVTEFGNSMPDWQLKQVQEIYSIPLTAKEPNQPQPVERSVRRHEYDHENEKNRYQDNASGIATSLALLDDVRGMRPKKTEADLRKDNCHRAFYESSIRLSDANNADLSIANIPYNVAQAKAENKNSAELSAAPSVMLYPKPYEANSDPDNHLSKQDKSIYDRAKALGLKPTIEMRNRMEDDAYGLQRWVIMANW